MNRYQVYLKLVDISFFIAAAHLVRILGQIAGFWGVGLPRPAGIFFSVATFLNLFLAVFLIVARPLRDEFAEQAWQTTAKWFVYVLATVPLVLAMVMPLFEDALRARVSNAWFEPDLLAEFARHPEPTWVFVGGFGHAIIMFAVLAPALFICIHKFVLWRASR